MTERCEFASRRVGDSLCAFADEKCFYGNRLEKLPDGSVIGCGTYEGWKRDENAAIEFAKNNPNADTRLLKIIENNRLTG